VQSVKSISVRLIFPALVIAMVVGNQLWKFGPFYIGQMISWGVDCAAAVIVVSRFRNKVWPLVLLACIILTRASGSGYEGNQPVDTAYLVFLNVLFCAAGAVVASRRINLVYRQVFWICLLCTPLMLLQMLGVGEWTQFLATEGGPGVQPQFPTLFVGNDDLTFSVIQGRPSGFLHSNNFLSIILLFALALHYSNTKTRKLNWRDLVLCTMVVLAMAKSVFLIFSAMVVWMLMFGDGRQRLRISKVVLLIFALFGLYALLFPGLFASNMSLYHLTFGFFVRANDFLAHLDDDSFLKESLVPYFEGTPTADWETAAAGLSGYTHALTILPYLIIGFVFLIPLFLMGFRKLRLRFPELRNTAPLTLFVVILYPAAVPFFSAQIYWFIAGFALLPLFVLLQPRYFRRKPPRLWLFIRQGQAN